MESTYSYVSTVPALEAVFHNPSRNSNAQVKELIFKLCDTTSITYDIRRLCIHHG